MGDLRDSSLLNYARFHGIATDHRAIDPLTFVNETCQIPSEALSLSQHTLSEVESHLNEIQKTTEQELRHEKLNVRKEGARYLLSVIRDASAPKTDINWDDYLPAFDRIDSLKVEVPVLPASKDISTLLSQKPLVYDENNIENLAVESSPSLRGSDLPDDLLNNATDTLEEVKSEKLACTKESLMLIQRTKECEVPQLEDLENLLDRELWPSQDEIIFPEPPLILSYDEDDTNCRSPSTAAVSQMLPSPALSEFLMNSGTDSNCSPPRNHVSELPGGKCTSSSSFQGGDLWVDSDIYQVEKSHMPYPQKEGSVSYTDTRDTPNITHSVQSKSEEITFWENIESSIPTERPQFSSQSLLRFSSQINQIICQDSHDYASCLTRSRAQSLTHEQPAEDLEPNSSSIYWLGSRNTQESCEVGCNETTSSYPEDADISLGNQASAHSIAPVLENSKDDEVASSRINAISSNSYHNQKPSTNHHTARKRKQCASEEFSQRGYKAEQTSVLDKVKSLSLSTNLGSLSIFMETRGQIRNRQPAFAKSPYFPDNTPVEPAFEEQNRHPKHDNDTTSLHEIESEAPANESQHIIAISTTRQQSTQVPSQSNTSPTLFISTTLLKSHTRLTQCLEETNPPPTLIYRDYNHVRDAHPRKPSNNKIPQQPTLQPLPKEADIIISPKVGIILTTSQAITQLYLPGHKPRTPHINNLACINSPLREQIFLLAPRYENLYVLVTHTAGPTKSQQHGNSPWTADKRVLASVNSLIAFCNSLYEYSTILPLLVPSCPETIAGWVVGLAHRHHFQMPSTGYTVPLETFTPVNPRPRGRGGPIHMERETIWELFLRRAGLNPYAAQAVLAILHGEEHRGKERNEWAERDDVDSKARGLARFIEMSSQCRRELFGNLIGERTVERMDSLVEKDWQCDWALDFDASAEI